MGKQKSNTVILTLHVESTKKSDKVFARSVVWALHSVVRVLDPKKRLGLYIQDDIV